MNNPRHFFLDSAERLDKVVEEIRRLLPSRGKPLELTVAPWHRRPSAEQYRYYWKRLQEISEQALVSGRQFSKEAWHEHYKTKFIGFVDLPDGGRRALSSSDYDPREFAEYTTRVEADAVVEHGVQFSDRRRGNGKER